MPLFQNSVVNKYLKLQNSKNVAAQWALFKSYFGNLAIQENIRSSKEEEFQSGFVSALFENILGYTLKPKQDYNLVLEKKNIKDAKKADGAILIGGTITAVIELKGTDTINLDKVEIQAFSYKNNHPNCSYVITSNFEKLRFYIDNAVEYIEFNLFELSEEEFQLLYLCLSYENMNMGMPKKLMYESVRHEEEITDRLYKDYSDFKNDLYRNMVLLNPQFGPLELFKISQKLLDRFLFIFFAEDRNLVPTNLIYMINKEWEQLRDMRSKVSLYDRYKLYFDDLNTGAKVSLPAFSETESTRKEDFQIYGYNGGLFKTDDLLNSIQIDDDVLFKHTEKLSNYYFGNDKSTTDELEVDVNILGHIFENSLNELEEVKARIEGVKVDKKKTKRKKDGVFYTPKYITKYIVDNTIGKLCEEKKKQFQINDDNYQPAKQRSRKRLENLQQYRNWLLKLTICDPACGSGAFLNQALEFLIAEHRYIDELSATYNKDTFVLSDVEGSILENNLFGVDLNEESVEIAKLSLWLRTAQPHRKLNDLSNNIKCGNSLISDNNLAGDKAFDWKNQFPRVFENGGFDIIIGNPPYVATKQIPVDHRNFYWKEYADLLFSEMDLYEIFLYKSVEELLKENGFLGFITPNSYYTNVSFRNLRKYLLERSTINNIIDFPYRFYPFDEVNTETSIITLKKTITKNHAVQFKVVDKSKQQISKGMLNVFKNEVEVYQDHIYNKFKGLIIINLNPVIQKLSFCKRRFGDYLELHKGWMSIPDKVVTDEGIINKGIFNEKEINANAYLASNSKHYLEGKDIHRYNIDATDQYVFIQGMDKKTVKWHFAPKIILQRIVGQNKNKIFATIDFDNYVIFPNANLVNQKRPKDDLRFYLAILNSRLISYYYNGFYGESNTNITKLAFESLPLPDISKTSQLAFIERTNQMLMGIQLLSSDMKKFQRTLQRRFNLEELPKKLQEWYKLSYGEFIKELAKKKIKLSLADETEWEEYFLAEQQKALALKTQIDNTDKEIDQMVYALYGLTPEEIEIVENS